jgi:hypothetical protein
MAARGGSSTLEETLAKFREDLDQSFFEKYVIKAASLVMSTINPTLNIL